VSRWQIVLTLAAVVVGIPTAILAGLHVYDWITSDKPKLVVCETQSSVGLPVSHREFLRWMDFGKSNELPRLSTILAQLPNARDFETVNELKKFAATPPVFEPVADPELFSVKVQNFGGKSANNVKVFFPVHGFAEIAKDGTALRTETTEGWIEIKTLEPATQCLVKFWSTRPFNEHDIRVTSDEITPLVRPCPCKDQPSINLWLNLFLGIAGGCLTSVAAFYLATRSIKAQIKAQHDAIERGAALGRIRPPDSND
jgi:hypothetical protein